jgi:hypothetical protein
LRSPLSGNDNGDQPLTQVSLAHQLAALKIYPVLLRIDGRRGKGYLAADFAQPPK